MHMCNKRKKEQSMWTALFGEGNILCIGFEVTFVPLLVNLSEFKAQNMNIGFLIRDHLTCFKLIYYLFRFRIML